MGWDPRNGSLGRTEPIGTDQSSFELSVELTRGGSPGEARRKRARDVRRSSSARQEEWKDAEGRGVVGRALRRTGGWKGGGMHAVGTWMGST